MNDDETRATEAECRELLDHVLQGEQAWMDEPAPCGLPRLLRLSHMLGLAPSALGDPVASRRKVEP